MELPDLREPRSSADRRRYATKRMASDFLYLICTMPSTSPFSVSSPPAMTAANDLGLTNAVPAKTVVQTDSRLRAVHLGNETDGGRGAARLPRVEQ